MDSKKRKRAQKRKFSIRPIIIATGPTLGDFLTQMGRGEGVLRKQENEMKPPATEGGSKRMGGQRGGYFISIEGP